MFPNAIADSLLPPASLAVLALVLAFAGRRWRELVIAVLVVLVLLSLPLVSSALLIALAPPPAPPGPPPQAIVVLSGDGIRLSTYELEPGLLTLDRVRAGVALARSTGLPILVSGGVIYPGHEPLAKMMDRVMQSDFRLPPRWVEDRSYDTWQNAEFSAAMLRAAGISRVYLVTHFWHMRRALLAFDRFGLQAVPAPVHPPHWTLRWSQLVPRADAWQESYFALHEWLGLAFYALRR